MDILQRTAVDVTRALLRRPDVRSYVRSAGHTAGTGIVSALSVRAPRTDARPPRNLGQFQSEMLRTVDTEVIDPFLDAAWAAARQRTRQAAVVGSIAMVLCSFAVADLIRNVK